LREKNRKTAVHEESVQPEQLAATVEYPQPAEPAAGTVPRLPVAFVQKPVSPAAELQTLLRKRLRFAAILFAGFYTLLLVILCRAYLGHSALAIADLVYAGNIALVIVVAGALAWVCGRARPFSAGQLRALEGVLFGVLVVSNVVRAVLYTRDYVLWQHLLALLQLGKDDVAADIYRAATGQFFGHWVTVILAYGVLIPNTARRCAAVVGALVLTALCCWGAIGLANGVLPAFWPEFWGYALRALAAPVAVAIYASHRIEQYRRQASAARKLGQYQLQRRLGKGGMGEVYLAEHVLLRRPCAVKLIRPDQAGDAEMLARFEREVQLTAALTHPNTIQVFDYGHAEDGTFYYAMEYLPGPNLEELVRRHGPLPAARAIHLLRQICGALSEAHGVGLIHRDIKPGNVIVCPRGGMADVAKLLDFGLVRQVGTDSAAAGNSRHGTIAGTPEYMSPEQATGRDDLDARCDIYGLGGLAYFLLTGRPPFAGLNLAETLAAHRHTAPAPLGTHVTDVPADLEAIVLRCLAKDPASRFSDARSLEAALAQCQAAGQWTETGDQHGRPVAEMP
jgi:serine/threonine-protein kinase